jgi:hypothetical protein
MWNEEIPRFMPAENLVFAAVWSPNKYRIRYYIEGEFFNEFESDYGVFIEPPKIEHYEFVGWYLDEKFENALKIDSIPAEDLSLYGRFLASTYELRFYDDEGEPFFLLEYSYNSDISNLTIDTPLKKGHSFVNWIEKNEMTGFEFSEMPGRNVDLYPSWEINQYQLNYLLVNPLINPLSNIVLDPDDQIIQVKTGSNHSAVLTKGGRLYTWGSNEYGQLGIENEIMRNFPSEITDRFDLLSDEKIIAIAMREFFSAALTSEGRVFTWGSNLYGQLGDGTRVSRFKPTDITNQFDLQEDDKIIEISIGFWHSSILTQTGRVFTWGSNGSGRLGDGTSFNSDIPIEITDNFDLLENDYIVQIEMGGWHSAALSKMGQVYLWGWNEYGQI